MTELEAAGRALRIETSVVMIEDTGDLDRAFAAMVRARVGGLVVDLVLGEYWQQIADLAIRHRLPAISGPREFAEAGG